MSEISVAMLNVDELKTQLSGAAGGLDVVVNQGAYFAIRQNHAIVIICDPELAVEHGVMVNDPRFQLVLGVGAERHFKWSELGDVLRVPVLRE